MYKFWSSQSLLRGEDERRHSIWSTVTHGGNTQVSNKLNQIHCRGQRSEVRGHTSLYKPVHTYLYCTCSIPYKYQLYFYYSKSVVLLLYLKFYYNNWSINIIYWSKVVQMSKTSQIVQIYYKNTAIKLVFCIFYLISFIIYNCSGFL